MAPPLLPLPGWALRGMQPHVTHTPSSALKKFTKIRILVIFLKCIKITKRKKEKGEIACYYRYSRLHNYK
jgi:hypothetical protein